MRVRITMAVAALLLAGCSSLRTHTPNTLVGAEQIAAAEAAQQARIAQLGLQGRQCDAPVWQMTGRVALSNGKDGGSGGIEWTQGAGRSAITLSAPVTRQSWTLVVDTSGALLDGVPNGPLRGADATELLRHATGWEIPVTALGCWLRGVDAAPEAFGEASVVFGTDSLPLRIAQGAWTIEYAGWALDATSGAMLPSRINAERDGNRVRLIADRWNVE